MSRLSLLAILAMSLVAVTRLPAAAQEGALLAELYGEGVHAYFAGDDQTAYAALTEAIESGTDDPRAFYFRGLVLQRMGRDEAAVADFEAGAVAEVRDTDRYYNVNASLQRVQGYTRLAIEDYRQEARLAMAAQVRQERDRLYSRQQRGQEEVLRGESAPASRDFSLPDPVDTGDAGDDDLFSDGGGLSGSDVDVPPAGVTPVEEGPADPLAPAADDDDLFGGETGSGLDAGDEDTTVGSGDEPFPFDFGDDDDDAMPIEEGGADIDPGAEDGLATPPVGGDEDDGPGGSFGLGDAVDGILGGGDEAVPGQGDDYQEGIPGMDDPRLQDPAEEDAEATDGPVVPGQGDDYQEGIPGMDDPRLDVEGDEDSDPFEDDVPRPEMQDEFLEEGDPVRPSDGIPEAGEEYEEEEGGPLEEEAVPTEDAEEDGPGPDFDELFGS